MGDALTQPSLEGLLAELAARVATLERLLVTPASLIDFQIAETTVGSFPNNTWSGIDSNDPTVTVPRAGVWEVTSICTVRPATAAASVAMGVRIDSTDPVWDTNTASGYSAVGAARQCLILVQRLTFTAGQVLAQRYFQNGGVQTFGRSGAMLMIRPIP